MRIDEGSTREQSKGQVNDLRRQHPRLDVQLAAEVQHESGVFTAVTRNLSAGGAALLCDQPIGEGVQVRLSLFLVYDGIEDERTPPLVVGATVAWVAEGDDGSHTAGVRFEGLSPAQTQWLQRFLSLSSES
ncbi:MAG: PilZ domain-containing protein [Pseudomonadota bacterium]